MTGRWDRLATDLNEAGIPANLEQFGESRKIYVRACSVLIIVSDTWSRDHWTGWQVYVEDAESIVRRTYRKTKKRGDVRRNVEDARSATH